MRPTRRLPKQMLVNREQAYSVLDFPCLSFELIRKKPQIIQRTRPDPAAGSYLIRFFTV
jgi:hypothetical protein